MRVVTVEGEFSEESDRRRLAPVMRAVVWRKLMLALLAGDVAAYRRHLNLQAACLKGLDVEPVEVLPALDAHEVDRFLHQNGFADGGRDAAGW